MSTAATPIARPVLRRASRVARDPRVAAVLRERIEEVTDKLIDPVVGAIGDDLDDVVATANRWADQNIDRGWLPPDPHKRASG